MRFTAVRCLFLAEAESRAVLRLQLAGPT